MSPNIGTHDPQRRDGRSDGDDPREDNLAIFALCKHKPKVDEGKYFHGTGNPEARRGSVAPAFAEGPDAQRN